MTGSQWASKWIGTYGQVHDATWSTEQGTVDETIVAQFFAAGTDDVPADKLASMARRFRVQVADNHPGAARTLATMGAIIDRLEA